MMSVPSPLFETNPVGEEVPVRSLVASPAHSPMPGICKNDKRPSQNGGLFMEKIVFRKLLADWFDRYLRNGNSNYADQSWRRLERTVLPVLGEKSRKGSRRL